MANRLDWCYTGGNFIGTHAGINWSDPTKQAWINWPRDVFSKMSGPEKKYIKDLYNLLVTGKKFDASGKVVATDNFMFPVRDEDFTDTFVWTDNFYYLWNRIFNVNEKNPSLETYKANARKFIYFDIVNLAPTMDEYMGFRKIRAFSSSGSPISGRTASGVPKKYNGLDTMWTNFYKKVGNKKYWGNNPFLFVKNQAFSEKHKYMISQVLSDQNYTSAEVRIPDNGSDEYYSNILNINKQPFRSMIFPYQEEFKLSWMRQLVQFGLEDSMGIFTTKYKSSTEIDTYSVFERTPDDDNPDTDLNVSLRHFSIGNLKNLIDYRYDYKNAFLFDWALNEYEWAMSSADKAKYGYLTEPHGFRFAHPEYNKYKWAKAPVKYLERLKDGKAIVQGSVENFLKNETDRHDQKVEETYFVTFPSYIKGKNFDFYPRQPWDVSEPSYDTPLVTKGVRPYYKNNADRTNNIVSGWVELPGIYGTTKVPWPFVWKYIGSNGFWQWAPVKSIGVEKSPSVITHGAYPGYGLTGGGTGLDVLSQFDVPGFGNPLAPLDYQNLKKNPSKEAKFRGGEVYLNKNYSGESTPENYEHRVRFWHFIYQTNNIPDRELMFYIRMKYGISETMGQRYSARLNESTAEVFQQTYEALMEFLESQLEVLIFSLTLVPNILAIPYNGTDPIGKAFDKAYNEAHEAWVAAWNASFGDWKYIRLRQDDCLSCGGLPPEAVPVDNVITPWMTEQGYVDPNIPASGQNGGAVVMSKANKAIKADDTEKNQVTIPHLLRSQYKSLIQDVSGWKLFSIVDGKPESPRRFSPGTRMKGGYDSLGNPRTFEIVDWLNRTGYFTFNGQGPDRPSFDTDDYYVAFKTKIRSAIKENDIPLYQLLELDNVYDFAEPLRPGKDRYSSPEHLQSYNWSTFPPKAENEKQMIYYHNHAVNPTHDTDKPDRPGDRPLPLSVKNEFNPALLSPKELQFMYEMSTYVRYGVSEALEGATSAYRDAGRRVKLWKEPWSNISTYGTHVDTNVNLDHRWGELFGQNNILLYNTEDGYNSYTRTDGRVFYQSMDVTTTLADYILWAAPTDEQYKKIDVSNESNNFAFLSRYLDNKKSGKIRSYGNWQGTHPKDLVPSTYPFHYFAEMILQSNDSPRPLVPAAVHYRYMTRKLNNDTKYEKNANNNWQESQGLNEWAMPLADLEIEGQKTFIASQLQVQRVFGGRIGSVEGQAEPEDTTDKIVLIALPRFILGGRKDLNEPDNSWDNDWGTCPFTMVNGKLVVGSLDTILDNWAKKKLYKNPLTGKSYYVSAMEISFWIRYRHGLAAAPTQRLINHPTSPTQITNMGIELQRTKTGNDGEPSEEFWPPFVKEFYISGNDDVKYGGAYTSKRNYFDDSGTLEESWRNRGMGNGQGETNYDPGDDEIGEKGWRYLLPTETLHGIPLLTSYYSPIVSGEDDSDPLIEINTTGLPTLPKQFDYNWEKVAYTGFNSQYVCHWEGANPVTTIRRTSNNFFTKGNSLDSYSRPRGINQLYTWIHRGFRKVERNYYKGSNYLVLGFDKSDTDRECLKTLSIDDIQSWFRAYKILTETQKYADYIERGLTLPEGHIDSVLEVEGEIEGEKGIAHFYISGAGIGSRDTTFRATVSNRIMTFSERMRVRPWVDRFESARETIQEEVPALCDDYFMGTKNCVPSYFYMRHILNPDTFMWISSKIENPEGGLYSTDQIEKTKLAIHKTLQFWTKLGYTTGTYFGTPDPSLSPSSGEPTTIDYSTKLTGLGLQVMTLSNCSSHWSFDNAYYADSRKIPLKDNLFGWLSDRGRLIIASNENKFIWNTGQKALTMALGFFISSNYYSKAIKDAGEALSVDLIAKYMQANILIENTYRGKILLYANLDKALGVSKDIIKYTKLFFEFVYAGYFDWLGIQRPKSSKKTTEIHSSLVNIYGYAKPFISYGKDAIFSSIEKAIVQQSTRAILAQGAETGIAAGRAAVLTGEAVAVAGLGTAVATAGATLVIAAGVWAVNYVIDRYIELWEANSQLEELWKKIHEAHNKGYLEGPYLQSDGKVKIKKLPTGEIPLLGKIYNESSPYKVMDKKNERVAFSNEISALNLEDVNPLTPGNQPPPAKNVIEFIKKQNDSFYKSGGGLDKILEDIKPDSCECEFFKGLYEEQTDSYKDMNWNKGHFKRRFLNRRAVVDEAPVYSDIPMVFQTAEGPYASVAWFEEIWYGRSDQYGQTRIPQGGRRNIRPSGGNGTRTTGQFHPCPRFWWPSILVTPNINLCKYMTLRYNSTDKKYVGGYYPEAVPEDYYICNQAVMLEYYNSSVVSKIDGTRIAERGLNKSPGRFVDILRNNLNDFNQRTQSITYINATYSRVKSAESSHNFSTMIPYYPINSGPLEIHFRQGGTNLYKSIPISVLYTDDSELTNQKLSYIGNGDSIYTSEGVNGPAPPHEREIISLFRRKHKIELVLPMKFIQEKDKNTNNYKYHPYKDTNLGGRNIGGPGFDWLAIPNNCCSITEIVRTELDSDGNQTDATEVESNNLSVRKKQAEYCQYLIALDTEEFWKKMINKCTRDVSENQDNTEKIRQEYTENTPIPSNLPRPEPDCKDLPGHICPDELIPQDGEEDPKSPPPHFPVKNPTIANCTNCEPDRPFVTESRQIIVDELTRRGRFRLAFNVDLSFSFFNLFSTTLDWTRSGNQRNNWKCPEWIASSNGCIDYIKQKMDDPFRSPSSGRGDYGLG